MHHNQFVSDSPLIAAWRGSVLLISTADRAAAAAPRFAAVGARVTVCSDDTVGDYLDEGSLCAIDADALDGGIDAARAIAARLARLAPQLPAIIFSARVDAQQFSDRPGEPVRLRAPLSALSLRVALGHILRGRMPAAA